MLRSAVSRAYYAAHKKAVIWAIKDGQSHLEMIGGDAHGELISYCKKHSDPDIKLVGQLLEQLRSRRGDCDYKSYTSETEMAVGMLISESKRVLDLIANK